MEDILTIKQRERDTWKIFRPRNRYREITGRYLDREIDIERYLEDTGTIKQKQRDTWKIFLPYKTDRERYLEAKLVGDDVLQTSWTPDMIASSSAEVPP